MGGSGLLVVSLKFDVLDSGLLAAVELLKGLGVREDSGAGLIFSTAGEGDLGFGLGVPNERPNPPYPPYLGVDLLGSLFRRSSHLLDTGLGDVAT